MMPPDTIIGRGRELAAPCLAANATARQRLLDGLNLDAQATIKTTPLVTLHDGNRRISPQMQKRVLQYLASFRTGQCWKSIVSIADALVHDESTVRRAIRAMVTAELIIEDGPRNRRTRAVHWTRIGILRGFDGSLTSSGTGEAANTIAEPGHSPGPPVSHGPVQPGRGRDAARSEPGRGSSLTGPHALLKKEKISSSSSSGHRDGDDESLVVSLTSHRPGTTTPPERPVPTSPAVSIWAGGDLGRITRALAAAGVSTAASSAMAARDRGCSPDDVLEAIYVVTHTNGLHLGALAHWCRNGVWPKPDVATAQHLREQVARAESIRIATRREMADRLSGQESWEIDGQIYLQLGLAKLTDHATAAERASWPRWQARLDAIKREREEQAAQPSGGPPQL